MSTLHNLGSPEEGVDTKARLDWVGLWVYLRGTVLTSLIKMGGTILGHSGLWEWEKLKASMHTAFTALCS